MIITQTRQGRNFVGCLNPETDMIESLTRICVDNSIQCAQFSGIGYIQNPSLRSYNLAARGFDAPVAHEGTFHVVSLHGNVSLRGQQTVIRAHVVGTLREGHGTPELQSGELVGGEVLSFEFSLTTLDDIRLYRADDDRTGLDPWLHMDLGEGPPMGAEESSELPVLPSAPGATPSARTDTVSREVTIGDWLDHPTLGTCKIVEAEDDERVTIILESGRRVVVNLAVLDLEASGPHAQGGHVFNVKIRRRR